MNQDWTKVNKEKKTFEIEIKQERKDQGNPHSNPTNRLYKDRRTTSTKYDI